MKPLFALGQLVATPGAIDLLEQNEVHLWSLVDRHVKGDWGDISAEDKRSNYHDAEIGNRVLSSYKLKTGTVWIITEGDRSVTTLLLPEEY